MIERLKVGLVIAAAATLLLPFIPQPVDAQQPSGRFRVIIPDVVPTDGSDPHFGERLSAYFRDYVNFPTHIAISRTELNEEGEQYGVEYQDLDCTTARQLANQIQAQLVMCGTYEQQNGQYQVDVDFYTAPAGDELQVDEFTSGQEEWVAAAEHLTSEFEELIRRTNQMAYCRDAYASSNWSDAVQYCGEALEYVPESQPVRFNYARALGETGEWDESLAHFEQLLENNPRDEAYLENAGYAAAQAGDADKARELYTRYLEENPDNVNVRTNVAYELAQAGDSYGAMSLLEEGLEQEPDNADLHDRYGTYAFRAAIELQDERQPGTSEADGEASLSPEVEELFRTAINSFEFVLDAPEFEPRVSHVTNMMRAYRQLGEPEEAIRVGEQGAEIFPEEAGIHSQLANAYNEVGDVDAAIAAIDEALAINPELSQGRMRKGTFLLEAGRYDEAIEALHGAAEAEEAEPDQLAGLLFQRGYRNHVQQGEFEEGLRLIEAAKEFDVSDQFGGQLDFIHGYSLSQYAEVVQEPNTLQSAEASLPMFRQARELAQAGSGSASASDLQSVLQFIDQYIDVQEAIIARERRP